MKREIEKELWEWRDDPNHIPLIVRGARQVGKTYAITQFGKEAFENLMVVNLERDKNLRDCFDTLDPIEIIGQLEVRTSIPVIPGKTLLFLDEIQAYPNALMALRYFKEELPNVHVIAAGSLLEFTLQDENFSFPVGRVQFMYLSPLSFKEFLRALGQEKLADFLSTMTVDKPVSEGLHTQLLTWVSRYFFLGGMPEVVQIYAQQQSYLKAQRIQQLIVKAYEEDFGKYAKVTQHTYLRILFERAPNIMGNHIKYAKIDATISKPERAFRPALENLARAGLIHRVYATAADGLPLRAQKIEHKLKIIFLDVGLMQCALGVDIKDLSPEALLNINGGALAEQFVGQELLAYTDFYQWRNLYFWERLKKGSEAEVDYVFGIGGHVIPIEVKAGKTGRLRSLQQFLSEKGTPVGVRISERPLSLNGQILSVPLYLISELPRLLSSHRLCGKGEE